MFSKVTKLLNNCTWQWGCQASGICSELLMVLYLLTSSLLPHLHTRQKTSKIFILSNSYTAILKLTETRKSVNSILTECLHGHYVTLVTQWHCNLVLWDKNYAYRINFKYLKARKHNTSLYTEVDTMTVSQMPQAGSIYKSILVSQNCDTQPAGMLVHNNNCYNKWLIRFIVNFRAVLSELC